MSYQGPGEPLGSAFVRVDLFKYRHYLLTIEPRCLKLAGVDILNGIIVGLTNIAVDLMHFFLHLMSLCVKLAFVLI